MATLSVAKCDSCGRMEEMKIVGNSVRWPDNWVSIGTTVHFYGRNPYPYDNPNNSSPQAKERRALREAFDRNRDEIKARMKENWPKMHICGPCSEGHIVGTLRIEGAREAKAAHA